MKPAPPVTSERSITPGIVAEHLDSPAAAAKNRRAAMAWRLPLVLLVYLALTALATWPQIARLGTRAAPARNDPLHVSWILAWDVHALATDPRHLFDANSPYPFDRALAFSEHLLGLVPLFAPVYAATGNALAGHNTLFVLSFPLSGLAA